MGNTFDPDWGTLLAPDNLENSEPIIGANVIFRGLQLGVATNLDGLFEIGNIPEGKHILNISFIGYYSITDTINFSGKDTLIQKNYNLPFTLFDYKLNPSKEIRKYHSELGDSINSNKNIINIIIDSLVYSNGAFKFHLTFFNNSNYQVYILRSNECINPFHLEVKDSSGKIINSKYIYMGCDVDPIFKSLIGPNDVVTISPKSYLKYPVFPVLPFNYKLLPPTMYYVRIIYTYEKPIYLKIDYHDRNKNIEEKYKPRINAVLKLIRGKYISKEVLIKNY